MKVDLNMNNLYCIPVRESSDMDTARQVSQQLIFLIKSLHQTHAPRSWFIKEGVRLASLQNL